MTKLKNRDPHSPDVRREVAEFIRSMTREEALAFLTHRTPGIELTDMTGMFSQEEPPVQLSKNKRRTLSK